MALTALLLWPIIGLAIFAAIGPVRGLIWATMAGYLFLPEAIEFDLPALPPFDKTSSISLSLALGALVFRKRFPASEVRLGDPIFRRLMLGLLGAIFVLSLFTVVTNGNAIVIGGRVRPGLSIRDAISMSVEILILLTPLLLAWRYLNRPEHAKELCVALVAAGLCYTLLVLFEIRMSPQLNRWVYGYFQHSWLQHLRDGDFRPIVFLQHGLWVGFLLLSLAITAFSLSRDGGRRRLLFLGAGIWTLGVLSISSNLGATLLAMIFCPAVLLMPRAILIRYAAIVSIAFLSYPALKYVSATPTEKVLELAERISAERAQSFGVRVRNEKQLLDRALEKPLFGWGGWARARVFDENGRNISVTDGRWIIHVGERGLLGYLAFFGFLALPVLRLARTARRKDIPWPIVGLTLVSAANFIEMIPNSALTPVGLLFFGTLAAFVQYDTVAQTAAAKEAPARAGPRYTRFDISPPPSDAHSDNLDREGDTPRRPDALPYSR